ncbi:MAG: hypothetical protein KAT04_06535 [Methylococcales bacterium]|nr:hypothetical protein [Methylococcales bacterium]
MAEKIVSKHLINLENFFAASNPVLQKACKTFHDLDQLEFDLGLIDKDETTARKSSWWPIISLIGGFSSAKSEFITRYLDANIHSSNHKFTVYQYSPQTTGATLPGTALDADHRLPFYQISQKIEQINTDDSNKINSLLELKTVNSEKLKGKLFIEAPVLNASTKNLTDTMLTKHVLNMSDLVLVFTDLFDAASDLIQDSIDEIIAQQESNKFIFVIDHSEISIDSNKSSEIIASWQRRLAELGIHTGQFIVLSNILESSINSSVQEINHRLENIDNDRSYRVLHTLEKSIRDINDIYIPEVEKQLTIWKDRANMSTLIILGFIISLLLFAEITMGVVQLIFDPIIGPIFILILIGFLIPTHILTAKVHAKFIKNTLNDRQKSLNLTENLSGLFEQSLTFWRIILPINEPVGKNKKTRVRLNTLIEQSKDLVQSLNDQFSYYQDSQNNTTTELNSFIQNNNN